MSLAKTMKLTQGADSVSIGTAPDGSQEYTISALVGDIAVGFDTFTPVAISALGSLGVSAFIIKEGEEISFVFRRENQQGALEIASANASGDGDSIASFIAQPL